MVTAIATKKLHILAQPFRHQQHVFFDWSQEVHPAQEVRTKKEKIYIYIYIYSLEEGPPMEKQTTKYKDCEKLQFGLLLTTLGAYGVRFVDFSENLYAGDLFFAILVPMCRKWVQFMKHRDFWSRPCCQFAVQSGSVFHGFRCQV